jgi:hypothetical protein
MEERAGLSAGLSAVAFLAKVEAFAKEDSQFLLLALWPMSKSCAWHKSIRPVVSAFRSRPPDPPSLAQEYNHVNKQFLALHNSSFIIHHFLSPPARHTTR